MTTDDTTESAPRPRGTDTASPTQKTRLKERLGVSEAVLTDAVELYTQVQQEDTRGHSADAIPIAVLYIAIRQHGVARSIEEVADAAEVSSPDLYRTARFVSDVLHQGIPPAEPELYVGRITDETGLSADVEADALRILSATKSADYHSGRNPEGLAAAAVYTALAEREDRPSVTQRELSDVTSVNVVTIRRSHQKMRELLDES
jgi:transcription initiation factor TFIIB